VTLWLIFLLFEQGFTRQTENGLRVAFTAFLYRFGQSFGGQKHSFAGFCEVLAVRSISLEVFVKF
jgi:hypothetical protein